MRVKESKTIRSFLAIEIDNDLIPKIANVQNSFKKTNTNIKYVSTENMHLTLKFFGNIEEEMVEDISLIIQKVISNYSSFDLAIENCGSFPNENNIKVLWLGIANSENNKIANLQKDLDKEFKKLGFKKEKNFISHLTIGRVKNSKNKAEIKNKIAKFKDIKIGKMTVNKISLKKSTLTSNGPIYEDINVFNLN